MDDYAGRVLADRYRLPLPPSEEYELTETRAFDTYSGQEVLVRQVPLPEVVEAEVLDAEGLPAGFTARDRDGRRPPRPGSGRRPADPVVRRAVEAAQATAAIPDHPRLDQVFDVFAEGGSLWIVSESVAARPLAALLAERPLTPYRAAEVASDVLMALRVLHGHGWVHRNITARTVLVCDDGRVLLTGLAVGVVEEALCGYDPVPAGDDTGTPPGPPPHTGDGLSGGAPAGRSGPGASAPGGGTTAGDVEAARRAAIEARGASRTPAGPDGGADRTGEPARRALESGDDVRAARAGAIAAYRAGARAAARVQGTRPDGPQAALPNGHGPQAVPQAVPPDGHGPRAALPGGYGQPRGPSGTELPGPHAPGPASPHAPGPASPDAPGPASPDGSALPPGAPQPPYAPGPHENGPHEPGPHAPGPYATGPDTRGPGTRAPDARGPDRRGRADGGATPPGQIADPYGVQARPWHGATPRPVRGGAPQGPAPRTPLGPPAPGAGAGRQALPPAGHTPGRTPVPVPPLPAGPGAAAPRAPASAAAALTPASGSAAASAGPPAGGWDAPAAAAPGRRGPATALAAERARQARMAVVGAVTERWAPEQAGPVHENWQLAAPIGPATDLWALGALLFRAVQGHAPYPEESTAELVQMVCAEPPAFAEECGPLRPVVESLLRQDPTERPGFEELRGWLRSLVRSAPEPDAGTHVVPVPPADPGRLPIVRRRGELVRRRRAGLPAPHGRHKRARQEERSPRSLGRTLLVAVLLAMAAAIAYAMLFLPRADEAGSAGAPRPDRTGAAGQAGQAPDDGTPQASSAPHPDQTTPGDSPTGPAGSGQPQTGGTDEPDQAAVPDGFTLRSDPAGFRLAVADGWDHTGRNGSGQVRYTHGAFELIVVPGRDGAAEFGADPMEYQREREPELQPYRDSSWATATGLKTVSVGGRTMAEGQFTWTGADGRELFVRNVAILLDGRYHVVQVRGPEAERDEVTRLYEQAATTYTPTR